MSQPACAYCGAHAPVLAPGQTTFVCAFCGKQTALEAAEDRVEVPPPPGPIRDEGARVGRVLATTFVAIGLLVVGGGLVVWRVIAWLHPAEPASCASYTGSSNRGTWSGCPSGATIELACSPAFAGMPGAPSGDDLTCHCLRDGTEEWFFMAQSAPPLAARADAERVGAASCKHW